MAGYSLTQSAAEIAAQAALSAFEVAPPLPVGAEKQASNVARRLFTRLMKDTAAGNMRWHGTSVPAAKDILAQQSLKPSMYRDTAGLGTLSRHLPLSKWNQGALLGFNAKHPAYRAATATPSSVADRFYPYGAEGMGDTSLFRFVDGPTKPIALTPGSGALRWAAKTNDPQLNTTLQRQGARLLEPKLVRHLSQPDVAGQMVTPGVAKMLGQHLSKLDQPDRWRTPGVRKMLGRTSLPVVSQRAALQHVAAFGRAAPAAASATGNNASALWGNIKNTLSGAMSNISGMFKRGEDNASVHGSRTADTAATAQRTFYHGSPNADLQTLAPGSYVTSDLDTAKLMGRFHADTGKTWSDDDLAEKHKFGAQPTWKPGREPAGEPAIYKLQAAIKQLNLLDNPYEHTTLESLPVEKTADLLPGIQLQEHQQRIQDTVNEDSPRMIVYHGLGSGKSLSALAAAEAAKQKYNEDYGIVAPASLRGNFQKEVEKFTTGSKPEILSYTGMGLGKKFTNQPQTVIMDEAHRLRNPGGAAAQAAAEVANNAKRLLLLTGSPITNSPSDLANLISLVTKKPISPQEFEKRYIGQKTVHPGLINYLAGIKPGVQPVIRNEDELKNLLKGHVDYQPSKTPEGVNVNEEKIQVPLTAPQQKIQKALRTKIPPGFLWKLDQEFPLGKDELSKLNSFLTGLRQNSVSTRPFRVDNDAFKAFEQSGKLQEAYKRLSEMLASDPRKKAIIYSNHIGAGVEPYAAALAANNIPHGIFHGGVPTRQRQQALADYNAGKLRALLIGPAGAEGISTKGTNLIQLLDPHWHESRSQQARGRGLRFDSHDDLPEELKNVAVQRFISKSEEPSFLGKMMGYRRERTGDEILERLSNEKEKINERFRQLLREVGTQPKTAALELKEAGFRWYKRFPMTDNLALNLSLGGPSLTVKKLIPGTSFTFGKRAPRMYVGTPIPGLAYQQYLSPKKNKIKAEKEFKDEPPEVDKDDQRGPLEQAKDFLFGSEYDVPETQED